MRIYLDTTIQELFDGKQISARTYNCLRYAGMVTLEDVQNYAETPEELLKLRNFGRKSYTEIEPLLREVQPEKKIQKSELPKAVFALVDDTIGEILKDAYKTLFTEDNDVTRFFKVCYPTVEDLHSKVIEIGNNLLEIHREFSIEENVEIRRMFARYLQEATSKMIDRQDIDNDTFRQYKLTLAELQSKIEDFSYLDKVEYIISPTVKNLIQSVYEQLCERHLSIRARHFVERYIPRFEILVPYFDADLLEYKKLCPLKKTSQTLNEIYKINKQLKEQFDNYWHMSDEEVQMALLRRDYPFLNSVERRFVREYSREYGAKPLFFLLYNYIRLSEERSNKIFCLLYGIFDGKERTMNELAEVMGLTRERIRQIVTKKLEVHGTELLMSNNLDNYAPLLTLPFITAESMEYLTLREREHLNYDFRVFARLLQLVGNYETEIVGGVTVAINRNALPSVKMSNCIDSLRSIVSSRYTKDTQIEISACLHEMPEHEKAESCKLMIYIAREGLGLEIVDNKRVLVSKNYIDVAEDLYDILAQKGETMSIDKLFEAFKQQYPDHKYTESDQIRPYLFRHPNIKSIGNTSCYGLDSWKHVFYGTIRDILVEQLEQSDEPLHIEQLFNAVLEHYPNTTVQSLAWSMADDYLGRFVHFNDGYYGLSKKEYDESYEEYSAERQTYRFSERFVDFRKFVADYNRYPVSSNGEHEASLYRWMYNVQNNVLDITDEQQKQLEDAIKKDELEYVPRNATENEFRNKCRDYKAYINSHYALPSVSTEPELYGWMIRSKANYNSYVDHRRKYLTDLFNYILSLGFSI